MSILVFVDANILLYSEDSRDLKKQQTALLWLDELWRRQSGRVGVQTLNEFYVNATRKLSPGCRRTARGPRFVALRLGNPGKSIKQRWSRPGP